MGEVQRGLPHDGEIFLEIFFHLPIRWLRRRGSAFGAFRVIIKFTLLVQSNSILFCAHSLKMKTRVHPQFVERFPIYLFPPSRFFTSQILYIAEPCACTNMVGHRASQ